MQCLLLLPSGFTMHIAFPFANVLSHVSLPPTPPVIMNLLSPVVTDTIFSDEPALGSNATAVQIFIGHNSKYINVYRVATDHVLSHTLEENIMNQGAMDILISNNACTATSQKVKDILHMYCVKSYNSEPHHQHKNYAEHCI